MFVSDTSDTTPQQRQQQRQDQSSPHPSLSQQAHTLIPTPAAPLGPPLSINSHPYQPQHLQNPGRHGYDAAAAPASEMYASSHLHSAQPPPNSFSGYQVSPWPSHEPLVAPPTTYAPQSHLQEYVGEQSRIHRVPSQPYRAAETENVLDEKTKMGQDEGWGYSPAAWYNATGARSGQQHEFGPGMEGPRQTQLGAVWSGGDSGIGSSSRPYASVTLPPTSTLSPHPSLSRPDGRYLRSTDNSLPYVSIQQQAQPTMFESSGPTLNSRSVPSWDPEPRAMSRTSSTSSSSGVPVKVDRSESVPAAGDLDDAQFDESISHSTTLVDGGGERDDASTAESSKKEKRRTQNRVAQRAFRIRSKILNREAAEHLDGLERTVEAQSQQIAQMSLLLERLSAENRLLRAGQYGTWAGVPAGAGDGAESGTPSYHQTYHSPPRRSSMPMPVQSAPRFADDGGSRVEDGSGWMMGTDAGGHIGGVHSGGHKVDGGSTGGGGSGGGVGGGYVDGGYGVGRPSN